MAERRNTIQKKLVRSTLCEMMNHPTADDIYNKIHLSHPAISRATVFRVLGRLADDGEILRVANGSGADSYDHNTKKHCHVRCIMCGRIGDIKMKSFPRPEQEIEDSCGYEIKSHMLLFEGVCKECKSV